MLIFVNSICFPKTGNETPGIFVYEQCKELLRLGHRVVILYPAYRSIKDADCLKKTYVKLSKYKEFDIYQTAYTWVAQNRCPILSALVYSKYLEKCYREAEKKYGKPDILYAHFSLNAGFGATVLGKKLAIPVVTLEHFSGFVSGEINRRTKYLLIQVIHNSCQFLCVSDNLRKNIERLTGISTDIAVLPDMVNDVFQYCKRENREDFVLFSVGGLIKRKNFHLLIDLFCKAFFKSDQVKLRIAGEGEDRQELEKLIDIYDRKDQITLCGSLDRNQLLAEYQHCDAFVLLSKKETFGIVYREAMCVGRPVISTRNGGIEFNWEDAYGILVNEEDEQEIMNSLRTMKNNINRYDSQYISDRTVPLYSEAKIGAQLHQILKTAVEDFGRSYRK